MQHVLLGEPDAHALGRVDEQRVRFPEREEPQAVVQIAVREQERLDRRMAAVAWMEWWKALDLRSDLGRGIQEKPAPTVGADRHGFLASRDAGERAVADPSAGRTPAVPLRESRPGRRTQDPDQDELPGKVPALPLPASQAPRA